MIARKSVLKGLLFPPYSILFIWDGRRRKGGYRKELAFVRERGRREIEEGACRLFIKGIKPDVGLVIRVAGLGSLGPEFEPCWLLI